jgi:hypothetical protein
MTDDGRAAVERFEKTTPAPVLDPSMGQTLADIETFLRSAGHETEVAIRNTHAGRREYVIAKVTGSNARAGRVYTNKSGASGGTAWYMKSGKNCFHPKGQSRLFIPTDEIRAFIAGFPQGVGGEYLHYQPDMTLEEERAMRERHQARLEQHARLIDSSVALHRARLVPGS